MRPSLIKKMSLTSPEATADFARSTGKLLQAGDVIGLEGPVGAGKSFFARALIQDAQLRAGLPIDDVPSPTFTLVQSYMVSETEVWHCDLYRLTDPSEALELGLDEALEDAICIVEWPERLGDDWPRHRALTLRFDLPQADEPETMRHLSIFGSSDWAHRLGEA